jgi:molybdenum cofactor synthesis domain-containing protein
MSEESNAPSAAILIIGNEVLSGRVQDANVNFIAKKLVAHGIRLREVRVVPDIEKEIVDAVNALRSRFSYVFSTGGIGPTHDDITAQSMATAFGVPLIVHPEAKKRLEAYYGDQITPARLLMARTPEGAVLIDNPSTIAPGFRFENVFVMAGVPSIMQAMFDSFIDGLAGGPAILSRTVLCKIPESLIAEELGELAQNFSDVDIGSYPSFRVGNIGLALVVRGVDEKRLDEATKALAKLVQTHGGDPKIE